MYIKVFMLMLMLLVSSANAAAPVIKYYTVIQVTDGDTIVIKDSDTKTEYKIRILGFNTPEKFTKGKPQCMALEASHYAEKTLLGKKVEVYSDPLMDKQDTYGRQLAHVFIQGRLFSADSTRKGFAKRYLFNGKTTIYDQRILDAENLAKEKHLGIWGKSCIGKK